MQPVVALRPDRETFPVVDCPGCGKRSLTWLDVGEDADVTRCLSCNEAIPEVRIVGARAVRALGYVFLDEKRRSAKASPKGRCGVNGVRGCGSGGCSSGGSCGTGGGCGGGCG